MKTNIFNRQYEIIDDVTIQLKSNKVQHSKKQQFEMVEGKFKLLASYEGKTLENITLYHPGYVSQMFSYESAIVDNDVDFVKCILTSNDLRHPLNEKTKKLELFDNGFIIKNHYVDIHPAYFFGKAVGFLFRLI
jgi:hypothetical protein